MLSRLVSLALLRCYRCLVVPAAHVVLNSPALRSAPVGRTLDVLFGGVRVVGILGCNTAVVSEVVAIVVNSADSIVLLLVDRKLGLAWC